MKTSASFFLVTFIFLTSTLRQLSSKSIIRNEWMEPDHWVQHSGASLAWPTIREPREASGHNGSSTFLSFHVTAIHVDGSEFPLSSLLFRSTLKLAVNEAQSKLDTRRVKLTLSVRSATTCSQQFAGALAAEEFFRRRSSLFIVSGCDDAIRSVSLLASQWSVPIMTAAGFGADLNDKQLHRSLIRVAFSFRTAVEFLAKILKLFNWQRVNLIVDESDTNSLILKSSIKEHIAETSINSTNFKLHLNLISLDLESLIVSSCNQTIDTKLIDDCHFNSSAHPDDRWQNELTNCAINDAIRQSSLFSRVNILLLPQVYLRRFMLSVHDLGLANGHYTFINVPILPYDVSVNDRTEDFDGRSEGRRRRPRFGLSETTGESTFAWRSTQSSARRNMEARRAFESLMSIYLKAPTTKAHVYFASRLNKLAEAELATRLVKSSHANSTIKSQASSPERLPQLGVNPYLAAFYDCIQIYASLLTEALDGLKADELQTTSRRLLASKLHANISRLARNRRYDNFLTGNIILNQHSDREADYTLDDMDPLTGTFVPVILYKGYLRELERSSRIHWSTDEQVGQTIDNVDCQLNGTCPRKPLSKFLVTFLLLACPLMIVMGSSLYLVYRRISLESKLVDYWWRINFSDIELVDTRRKLAGDSQCSTNGALESATGSSYLQNKQTTTSGSKTGYGKQLVHQASCGSSLDQQRDKDKWISDTLGAKTTITKVTQSSVGESSRLDVCYGDIQLGNYKLSKVAIKPIAKFHQSRKLMIELRTLKEVNHSNLCRFVGIVIEDPNTALISEFCPKGSLREFFKNEFMIMDWTFKCSIINDILSGLVYLHSSPLEFHGRLKSSNCLVSSRFVVKLTDFGLGSLHEYLDEQEADEEFMMKKILCRAPEHMKSRQKYGSKKGDVYSFGLLLYEILTNNLPFFDPEKEDYVMPLKSLIQELKASGPNEKTGPNISNLHSDNKDESSMVELMRQCWQIDISKRPSTLVLATAVRRITRGVTSKKLLENLTCRMEQYTNNLESLVEAKLATLVQEKQKTEELLYQFVPQSIASRLKDGETIEPEAFSCVTVLFSDIVGFTSLSSESTPMEVIDFLSDLYLCFDETLEQYDIFKVDTIGDAYIVASGLPEPNEGKHVVEIARAALELRQRLKTFEVAHKPNHRLQMRVGIHSGPCIAGIVGGTQMPKYCVFGDTLSMGKFMESSGLPMKIHVTAESHRLLQSMDMFKLEPRLPSISREGIQLKTFWLESNEKLVG